MTSIVARSLKPRQPGLGVQNEDDVFRRSEIRAHQLARPPGLTHTLLLGKKLGDYGLNINHRRAVESVQATYANRSAFDSNNFADRRANPVGALGSAMRKDADLRPIRIFTWMSCSRHHRVFRNPVEVKEHLNVRKLL